MLYAIEGEDNRPHTHGCPGLQHLAVEVEDRGMVEQVHQAVAAGGFPIVHEPREYPGYAPGYWAVFVSDVDGNRWEIAHIPIAPDVRCERFPDAWPFAPSPRDGAGVPGAAAERHARW
ncbi:VOC family protein [Nocardia fluminea]|uniref:VOC family protein n=1 Tax=Nocardia fluminea TaxID=134984 RepID=UPI00380789BD